MTDSKNGKGGFKEFAKHEKVLATTPPLELVKPATPTSILGAPAARPAIAPKPIVKP